jgi:hypothetical protein
MEGQRYGRVEVGIVIFSEYGCCVRFGERANGYIMLSQIIKNIANNSRLIT